VEIVGDPASDPVHADLPRRLMRYATSSKSKSLSMSRLFA
jgi:hypothetical protein